jgi:hypothetical protein
MHFISKSTWQFATSQLSKIKIKPCLAVERIEILENLRKHSAVACKNLIVSLLVCTATAVLTLSHAIELVTVTALTASNEYLKLDVVFNTIHDINARSSEFAADEENKLLKRYDQGRCNLFIHIDSSHGAIIDSKKTSKMVLYPPCRTHLPVSKKKVSPYKLHVIDPLVEGQQR